MNGMTLNWYKSIKNRTSVREFSDTVDQKTFTELKKFAAELNNDEARLVLRSRDGVLKSIFLAYGRVVGTKCFAAVITKKNSKYMGGYIGEAFVLECAARGIATCWLGASYKKSKVREFVDIKEDETLACIIAFGFYDGKIKRTKKKSIEQLTGLNAAAFSALPAWQQEAVNCARLSPSALNKQPWELDIKENSIELINNSNNWGFGGVDCGIAMLHLELGAEVHGVFGEWKFKDGAPVFIPLPQSANCHDESEAYDEEDEYNDEFRYKGSSSADDAADSDVPNVEVESSYNFNIGQSKYDV